MKDLPNFIEQQYVGIVHLKLCDENKEQSCWEAL